MPTASNMNATEINILFCNQDKTAPIIINADWYLAKLNVESISVYSI